MIERACSIIETIWLVVARPHCTVLCHIMQHELTIACPLWWLNNSCTITNEVKSRDLKLCNKTHVEVACVTCEWYIECNGWLQRQTRDRIRWLLQWTAGSATFRSSQIWLLCHTALILTTTLLYTVTVHYCQWYGSLSHCPCTSMNKLRAYQSMPNLPVVEHGQTGCILCVFTAAAMFSLLNFISATVSRYLFPHPS